MTNLIEIKYDQTGKSNNTDAFGMREMKPLLTRNDIVNICLRYKCLCQENR